MSGEKEKPDRREPGWRDYARTERVGERDGMDELEETEEQLRGETDADGDGSPEPAVGSSDFVSRDVETELRKDRLKNKD